MKFSRHAKNSMRLYGITVVDVERVLLDPDRRDGEGRYLIAYRQFLRRFGDAPLKVVYVVEDDTVIVTVYPLKQTHWRSA